MVDNARQLAERLKSTTPCDVTFIEYRNEDHGSVQTFTIARGVRFFLTPLIRWVFGKNSFEVWWLLVKSGHGCSGAGVTD
jgi:hypothetical protein